MSVVVDVDLDGDGVRNWIQFVDAWPATTRVEFVECSPAVVMQLT